MQLPPLLAAFLFTAGMGELCAGPIITVTSACGALNASPGCPAIGSDGSKAIFIGSADSFSGLGTSTITGSGSVAVSAEPGTSGGAHATAELTLSDTLDTAGPVREGLATYLFSVSGSFDSLEVQYGVGIVSVDNVPCNFIAGTNAYCQATNVPFVLGVPFNIQASASANSGAGYYGAGLGSFGGSAFGGFNFTLTVTDLSGDPIAITETPEPVALVPFGLVGIFAAHSLRRRRKCLRTIRGTRT